MPDRAPHISLKTASFKDDSPSFSIIDALWIITEIPPNDTANAQSAAPSVPDKDAAPRHPSENSKKEEIKIERTPDEHVAAISLSLSNEKNAIVPHTETHLRDETDIISGSADRIRFDFKRFFVCEEIFVLSFFLKKGIPTSNGIMS
jgi:hypothetical protein